MPKQMPDPIERMLRKVDDDRVLVGCLFEVSKLVIATTKDWPQVRERLRSDASKIWDQQRKAKKNE